MEHPFRERKSLIWSLKDSAIIDVLVIVHVVRVLSLCLENMFMCKIHYCSISTSYKYDNCTSVSYFIYLREYKYHT